MYDKATPTDSGQAQDVVGHASAGGTPTLGENRDAASGDRTGVIHSIPMGTDYMAIENAFANKRVISLIEHRQATDGGMGD